MHNKTNFDVLVVYSDGIAQNASNKDPKITQPFSLVTKKANYNLSYSYFIESCYQLGLNAALSTSDTIIAPGTCSSYWTYKNNSWKKHNKHCYSSQIFDKISPTSSKKIAQRKRLFASKTIASFNSPELTDLFSDKLKTYAHLTLFTIPTVYLQKSSHINTDNSLKKLESLVKKVHNPHDFSKKIILKDRYGAGGNKIFLITKNFAENIDDIQQRHPQSSFVIQPLINFDKGFRYNGVTAATDIRLIYLNGKIFQTYIRIAKAGDFRCNEHQGGTLQYVDIETIPEQVLLLSEKVIESLCYNTSLFALDYLVSNSGKAYLLEGNTGPGIDWNLTLTENEQMSKKLIDAIAIKFAGRLSPTLPNNTSE